jgi:hypothetical protein
MGVEKQRERKVKQWETNWGWLLRGTHKKRR